MREDVRRECQVDREDCALCEGDVRVLELNVYSASDDHL